MDSDEGSAVVVQGGGGSDGAEEDVGCCEGVVAAVGGPLSAERRLM